MAARTTDLPGETFRVLKTRAVKEYGEYRRSRLPEAHSEIRTTRAD